MAKISVLMTVYNDRNEWLTMSIDSILNQTYTDFEFIIVNDNPKDERICRILSSYAERDSRIVLVVNENHGRVNALNVGVAVASGEYLAVMDGDDYAHPDRFEKELDYMEKNSCDMVSVFWATMDENSEITDEGRALRLSPETVSESLRWGNMVLHTAWIAKMSVYRRLGGYRNVMHAEDYDFLLRARESGYRIGITPHILANVRVRKNSISTTNVLHQFIVLYYLAEHAKEIFELDPDKVNTYVDSKVTKKRNAAYIKATEYIRIASKSGKVKMLVYVMKALFTSRYAWKYILHTVHLRKIKRKG